MAASKWDNWNSRKYRTAWYLTFLATIVTLAPVVGDLFKYDIDKIVDGYQWLTFLFGMWGIYFGVNVAEKANMFNSTINTKVTKDPRPDPPKDGE